VTIRLATGVQAQLKLEIVAEQRKNEEQDETAGLR
jgi:hypothetical protein